MTCDSDKWTRDPKEVEHLSPFATEPHIIAAMGDMDGIPPWIVGRDAGFSGGTTTDETKRRANWASAASKATRLNKKTLPHIAALKEQLARFRSDGGEPQSVSWKDKLARCEWLIRHGTPSESLRAIDMHNKMKGRGDSAPKAERLVAMTEARVGREQARIGIEALFPDLVFMLAKVDPAAAQARELESLNGANVEVAAINERMGRLEVEKKPAMEVCG